MILISGLKEGLDLLKLAGCVVAYIDGSFVTSKEIPGDFDVCWQTNGVDVALLDPVFLDFSNRRQAQKNRFHGEFFPAEFPAGSGMTYLEFFQTEKDTARRKGIRSISLGELP